MRIAAMTWLACFAGALASATGTLAIARRAPCCNIASPTELSSSWSNVSPELLNKYGGATPVGGWGWTEKSSMSICQTNVCRNTGGHSFMCMDTGIYTTYVSSGGFSYKTCDQKVCGNEYFFTFENCVSFYRNNGACFGGAWTYFDFHDP